jgi:hypothetical protein
MADGLRASECANDPEWGGREIMSQRFTASDLSFAIDRGVGKTAKLDYSKLWLSHNYC